MQADSGWLPRSCAPRKIPGGWMRFAEQHAYQPAAPTQAALTSSLTCFGSTLTCSKSCKRGTCRQTARSRGPKAPLGLLSPLFQRCVPLTSSGLVCGHPVVPPGITKPREGEQIPSENSGAAALLFGQTHFWTEASRPLHCSDGV